MLPLYFGATALEKMAVLEFLSTSLRVTLERRLSGRGDTAVINTDKPAVCREHSLACFHAVRS